MASNPPGQFSLFPNPNTAKPPPPPPAAVIRLNPNPRPRRSASRDRKIYEQQLRQEAERAATPQGSSHQTTAAAETAQSPPRPGRETPQQQRTHTPLHFEPVQRDAAATVGSSPRQKEASSRTQQPRQVGDVPARCETALSEANTLVRSESTRSRSSIAKPPLTDGPPSFSYPRHHPPAPLRSIFPTYNPELPLDQQPYGPTQLSPTRVPRAVISRQSYYDPEGQDATDSSDSAAAAAAAARTVSPPMRNYQPNPAFTGTTGRHPAARDAVAPREPPVVPKTSTTTDLRSFWKAANGWKASSSEGQVFCLKLSQLKDAPVYTLASATQPFYNLRLDPTSASAYVSLSRHDPSKPYKASKPDSGRSSPNGGSSSIKTVDDHGESSGKSGKAADSKNWQEALSTSLEEDSRRHAPNDGLVALLMPTPAIKMATEKANDAALVAMAERECARLVWDDDSASHYLVHPALAAPFCVTVERCPSWSRVEYTLEHHESPRHLAKLTRDGTGGGWLEIDTTVASQIDAYYIVDVAVTALLLVAISDERNSPDGAGGIETFEPPPVLSGPSGRSSRSSGRFSRLSGKSHNDDDTARKQKGKKQKQKQKHKQATMPSGNRMEEFELDLESQADSLRKVASAKTKEVEDKLPFALRVVVKLVKGVFKCFLWILTVAFKVASGMFNLVYKCVGSKY